MNELEIRYPFHFLNKELRDKSSWNKHHGSYTKDFIFYIDGEYKKLLQKKTDILYLNEYLQGQLVDTNYEIERIHAGNWWFV